MIVMNRNIFVTLAILAAFVSCTESSVRQPSASASRALEEGFLSPPDDARPRVWWHWMNGNVTREGITADLEAMAEIGLGGAQFFDALG